jgi:hypothetical protein
MWRSFWDSENGAVTVDWVVVTAATVGLGLSAAAAVRVGTGNMAGSINTSLSAAAVVPLRWLSSRDLVQMNFADGNFDGWNAIRTVNFGEWGTALGPFANDTRNNPLTFDVALSDGARNALVQFDLIIGDSWDGAAGPDNPWTRPEGDVLQFQINGQTISAEPFVMSQSHVGYRAGMFEERKTSVQINGATYNLLLQPADLPVRNMGSSAGADQRWRVTLEAVDAPQNFTLGYSAITSQAASNESFSIANFNIREN